MVLQCHPRSLSLAKIESPYYLLIINNNLGGILPHFIHFHFMGISARFLLKTALHSYSIRILGCSPCTRSKMLDLRDAKMTKLPVILLVIGYFRNNYLTHTPTIQWIQQRYRQTDRQTTFNSNTALYVASRGQNHVISVQILTTNLMVWKNK